MGMKVNSYKDIERTYSGKFGYMANLPDQVRVMFMWICQDLAILDRKWRYYTELYLDDGNKKKLVESARSVFSVYEEVLFFDILLSVARLNDDQYTGKWENISLDALTTRARMKTQLRTLMNRYKRSCRSIEMIRNKRLAHRDFNTIDNPEICTIPAITVQEITTAIELAKTIVITVLQKYCNYDMTFKLTTPGGPDQLLQIISQRVKIE